MRSFKKTSLPPRLRSTTRRDVRPEELPRSRLGSLGGTRSPLKNLILLGDRCRCVTPLMRTRFGQSRLLRELDSTLKDASYSSGRKTAKRTSKKSISGSTTNTDDPPLPSPRNRSAPSFDPAALTSPGNRIRLLRQPLNALNNFKSQILFPVQRTIRALITPAGVRSNPTAPKDERFADGLDRKRHPFPL